MLGVGAGASIPSPQFVVPANGQLQLIVTCTILLSLVLHTSTCDIYNNNITIIIAIYTVAT